MRTNKVPSQNSAMGEDTAITFKPIIRDKRARDHNKCSNKVIKLWRV